MFDRYSICLIYTLYVWSILYVPPDMSQWVMERSALALVNGEPWDMHRPLPSDCTLQLLHFQEEDPTLVNNVRVILNHHGFFNIHSKCLTHLPTCILHVQCLAPRHVHRIFLSVLTAPFFKQCHNADPFEAFSLNTYFAFCVFF